MTDDKIPAPPPGDDEEALARKQAHEERIKQLAKVVCICKGIPLGRILPVLGSCDTVADVNRMTGCGSGGCQGERCGPRIKLLLRKVKEKA